ncbi:MAG TPA: hypothetical protein DHV48_20510 [Prolixibacteraceae bacterium]|nr:hypothetical protein [Prolixibacteraceae bacterium]
MHLLPATGNWNLSQIFSCKLKHTKTEKQPGEPEYSILKFEAPEVNSTLSFIITAQDATISAIRFEFDNCCELKIPVMLNAGESVRYSGGENAAVFNNQLQKIKEIPVDSSKLMLGKGSHSVVFDCNFSSFEKEPAAKLEFRIKGKTEEIRGAI